MRYILLFIPLFLISPISADYDNVSVWSGNITMDNVTEDLGDGDIKCYSFANNFNDGNHNGTLFGASPPTISVESGTLNITATATENDSQGMYWNTSEYYGNYSLGLKYKNQQKGIDHSGQISYMANSTSIIGFQSFRDVNWNFANPESDAWVRFATRTNDTSFQTYKVNQSGDVWKLYEDHAYVNTFTAATSKIGNVFWITAFNNQFGITNTFWVDDVWISIADSGNLTRNIKDSGIDKVLLKAGFNGTKSDGISNVNLYVNASDDNFATHTGWHLFQSNATSLTLYDIPGGYQKRYYQTRHNLNTSNVSVTPIIEEMLHQTGTPVGSVEITYYDLNFSHLPANVYINISNKTGSLSTINIPHTANDTHTYCFNYPNDTAVQACITATSEGQIIWFNGSADRLSELNGYYIPETEGAATSTIIIPANSLGMFNNWTVATNFSNIAANESNDVCYSYYNVTTGEWESYYVGYSWNADGVVPNKASVVGFFSTQTNITSEIKTPADTNLSTGWNMIFIMGTDNETIADIKADIGVNCSDVWWFNSTSGSYSNTSTDTVQPCQGFLAYLTQNMTPWTRSGL